MDRALVGFEMQDRLIARDACTVSIGGKQAGRVTSGSPAPFLEEEHRHGLRSDGIQSAGNGNRHRHPCESSARANRSDAVLQAKVATGFSLSLLFHCSPDANQTG